MNRYFLILTFIQNAIMGYYIAVFYCRQIVSYIDFQGNHNDIQFEKRRSQIVSYIDFQGNHNLTIPL